MYNFLNCCSRCLNCVPNSQKFKRRFCDICDCDAQVSICLNKTFRDGTECPKIPEWIKKIIKMIFEEFQKNHEEYKKTIDKLIEQLPKEYKNIIEKIAPVNILHQVFKPSVLPSLVQSVESLSKAQKSVKSVESSSNYISHNKLS